VRSRSTAAAALAFVALAAHAGEATRPRPVPPERAAKPIASVPLANPGFESGASGATGAPEGWLAGQHAGAVSYTFTLDAESSRTGQRSLRIDNVGPEPYGTVDQSIDASPLRGKTLRFSAWLRTRDVTGNRFGNGAGLRLQTMRGGYVVEQAQMRGDAVAGTTDWARYEVRLRVADTTEQIDVGVHLFGPGTVWVDDAALDVVDAAVPTRGGAGTAGTAARP
jgi:hypothetical protein